VSLIYLVTTISVDQQCSGTVELLSKNGLDDIIVDTKKCQCSAPLNPVSHPSISSTNQPTKLSIIPEYHFLDESGRPRLKKKVNRTIMMNAILGVGGRPCRSSSFAPIYRCFTSFSSFQDSAPRPARVVVVGSGRMGQIRSSLLRSNPKFELVGIVDNVLSGAEKLRGVTIGRERPSTTAVATMASPLY